MADTIYLNSFSMDKLICLCAHDFKHDFIEDSDRPKLALGSERFVGGNPKLQYRGTSSTTETVDKGETKMGTSSLVFPGTPLSEEKGYVVNPEDFPLACYIYLNIADMCKNDEAKTLDMFNKFCDNLGKINERIGLQKKKNEARQKKREALYAEAQQSSKKRRTIEGGNPVVGGSLISGKPLKMRYKSKLSPKIRYKYGQGTQNRTEKTAQRQRGNRDSSIRASRGMDQLSPERTAAASRPRRVPRLNYAERDDVGPVNSNKLIEWDKMLEIYKDWLSSDGRNEFYQDLNNLLNIQKPIEDDKRSFLIPSSEWEGYEHSGTEYIEWIGMLRKRGGVKNAFNEIIKKCYQDNNPGGTNNYPQMISLKISPKKWENIKQYSEYLLKEWEKLVTANPGDDQIYRKDKISSLQFKDENMWKKSKNYYKSKYVPPTLKNKDPGEQCARPPPHCPPFNEPPLSVATHTIINNSATLSKYIDNSEDSYICPIPSIIDPQSVCNSIPHRLSPQPLLDYSVNVMEVDGRGRKICVEITNVGGTNYKTKISFNLGDEQFIEREVEPDFAFGGSPLSAYNVTLMFIRGFLKEGEDGGLNEFGDWVNTEHDDPEGDPPIPSTDEETLRSIAGIFALKLMGDFSQELYAISKNSTINPLLFLANDRVSAARYLLLKVHGKRPAGGGDIIAEPGGGGFLSYGGKKNNYFLLMGPVPPQPGGGKKKKTKRKKRIQRTKKRKKRIQRTKKK